MSDDYEDAPSIGDNSGPVFKDRVQRRVDLFEQADELAKTLKDYDTEDKSDGLNVKLIKQIVKELRDDPEKFLDKLVYEAEVDAGRKAVGLSTDIEAISKIVQERAEAEPETKSEKKKKKDGKPRGRSRSDKTKH
ncbi:MAG TPA: hypothetical protein PKE16_12005 [Hyphomicrobium sp.]|nr:hypothetical protein [Hyphomicrobium sp.]